MHIRTSDRHMMVTETSNTTTRFFDNMFLYWLALNLHSFTTVLEH